MSRGLVGDEEIPISSSVVTRHSAGRVGRNRTVLMNMSDSEQHFKKAVINVYLTAVFREIITYYLLSLEAKCSLKC